MRRRCIFCLSLIMPAVVVVSAEPLQSQETLRRALDLQAQRQYAQAEALLTGLVASQPDDLRAGVALSILASGYRDEGKYLEAEKTYRHSMDVLERVVGPNSPYLVKAGLCGLAVLYLETGELAKAKTVVDRALRIADSSPGVDSELRVMLLDNLGSVYARRRQYAEAEPLYQQALALDLSSAHSNSLTTAAVLNNLAAVAAQRQDLGAAVNYSERSVAILERHEVEAPAGLARCLLNLGLLNAKLGRKDVAETYLKRALAVSEHAFGPDHPLVGTVLASYAAVLRDEGRKRDAKRLEKRAQTILARSARENNLGQTVDVSALVGSRPPETSSVPTGSWTGLGNIPATHNPQRPVPR